MCVFEFQNHGAVVDRKTMAIMTPKPDVLWKFEIRIESKQQTSNAEEYFKLFELKMTTPNTRLSNEISFPGDFKFQQLAAQIFSLANSHFKVELECKRILYYRICKITIVNYNL